MKIIIDDVCREMTVEEEQDFYSITKLSVPEQITKLKNRLSETDYKAIKYAEGLISEEEYAPIRAERQQMRAEINKLEEEIQNEH